jgi:SAM-dependent methyltransferase
MLTGWVQARNLTGAGGRAIVVGCGLGADAEYLASLGFDTVGFDISQTAIRLARERFPGSAVRYMVLTSSPRSSLSRRCLIRPDTKPSLTSVASLLPGESCS